MDEVQKLYRAVFRIRSIEEKIAAIYPTDKIKSPIHLSIGQEAVSVGVCSVLRTDDIVFGTYRGHALYLAKGGNLKRMIAELYGKITGCAHGKGGSMHLVDIDAGFMGTSAIVATTIPQAVGYALAVRQRDEDKVVVCFFGDGATDEGAFHESLNFAAIKKLPILFVCENNYYAIHSHVRKRSASTSMIKRAQAYGLDSDQVTDGDIFSIRLMAGQIVQSIRNNNCGAFFMECFTCREREHVGPGMDWNLGYRGKEELKFWRKHDAVSVLSAMLAEKMRIHIEQEVNREINEAFKFAEDSPFPDEKELLTDVFK